MKETQQKKRIHRGPCEQEAIRSGLPVRYQSIARLGMACIGGPARRWHCRYPHFRSASTRWQMKVWNRSWMRTSS